MCTRQLLLWQWDSTHSGFEFSLALKRGFLNSDVLQSLKTKAHFQNSGKGAQE